MECIDEGNTFGLNLGDIVYRFPIGVNPGTERFTKLNQERYNIFSVVYELVFIDKK